MTKNEELELFLNKADELINGQYIVVNIKIVNLLRAIASSETLLAIFKNCLTDFDYYNAKKKYLVKSQFSAGKGEFITPPSSKELLALVFNVLMDIDSERINFNEFLDKYFYVDGSSYSAYSAFINQMIKPFKNAVKLIMDSVLEGKLQDPIEALSEAELKRAKEKEQAKLDEEKEKELSSKAYGESVKKIKNILTDSKQRVKASKLKADVVNDIMLVIDMLGSVIESEEQDAIEYAFVSFKYVAKAHPVLLKGAYKKISKYIKDIK